MIKRITATNHLNDSLTLDLTNPYSTGFVVLGVDGLSAPKANINMSESVVIDGSFFNSAHAQHRNIVIRLKLLENPTIEHSRHILYSVFQIKKKIRLDIETHSQNDTGLSVYTEGYVESVEPEIFSSMCAAQISIICPSPYLRSKYSESLNFESVLPLFSFPFPEIDEYEQAIEPFAIGEVSKSQTMNIVNNGEIDTGFIINLDFTGPTTDTIEIGSVESGITMSLNLNKLVDSSGTSTSIVAGDRIIIDTISGERSLQLLRNGRFNSIIKSINRRFDWLYLVPGNNGIYFNGQQSNVRITASVPLYYQGL